MNINIPFLEQAIQKLDRQIEDPARRVLARGILTDLTRVNALAVEGKDVSTELVHLDAQIAGLTSAERRVVSNAYQDFALSLVRQVARAALVGL